MANFAARLLDRLGDDSGLIDAPTGEVIGPAEVRDAVSGFAAAFHSEGLKAGDRILIACETTPASSLAYLGALYAGLVPVPVHETVLGSGAEAIFQRSGARASWLRQACDSVQWIRHHVPVRLVGRLDRACTHRREPTRCKSDDLAVLMPTSGSTGQPRLVEVTHGNLIANTEAIVRSQRLSADERAMLILPVSYCYGASVLHTHLYQGGAVVFDSRFMFPDKVLRAITEHRCTTFAGVPTVFNILLRRSNIRRIPLPTLRRFLQAGGPLPPERVEDIRRIAPHVEFFVMYGQSEATARISCLSPADLDSKRGSVGLPLDNLRVRIVNEQGHEARAGETGEVWVSGDSICRGYYDDPEATAHTFRGGWLRTGDIGKRDEDGYLWIVGRKSEFIKMRGIRLSYAEIEARIAAAAGVRECAAVAVPHPEAGEALALYVVLDTAGDEALAEIRRKAPSEWIIDSIRRVETLPRNASGKLVRSRLAPASSILQ